MAKISKREWFLRAIACVGAVLGPVAVAAAQSPTWSITLTGQSMVRSDMRVHVPAAVPTIASLLQGDVIFTNFEATIFDARKGQSPMEGRFLSPPEALESLKTFGFNLLSLSNNHSWDFKVSGIENTLAQVGRLDLAHAGIGHTVEEAVAPGYLRTPKGTVALVAMASGLIPDGGAATATRPGVNELRIQGNAPNPEDAQRILQSIRTARERADLVIVYQHNHVFAKPFATIMGEELPERLVPPDWLKAWTHAEIDAGADIVVMHGAPLLHGVEIYRGRPIFFDLGNFIFQLPPTLFYLDEPIIWESVVAYVEFEGPDAEIGEIPPHRAEQDRGGPTGRARGAHQQSVLADAGPAAAGHRRASPLYPGAARRSVAAVWNHRGGDRRYRGDQAQRGKLSRIGIENQ